MAMLASSSALQIESEYDLKALHKTSLGHKDELAKLEKSVVGKYGSKADYAEALKKVQATLKKNEEAAAKATKHIDSLGSKANKVRKEEVGTLGKQIKDEGILEKQFHKNQKVYAIADSKISKEINWQKEEQVKFGKGESKHEKKKIDKIKKNPKLTHAQKKQAVKKVVKKHNEHILKKIMKHGIPHTHHKKHQAHQHHSGSTLFNEAEHIDKDGVVSDPVQIAKTHHKPAAKHVAPAKKAGKHKSAADKVIAKTKAEQKKVKKIAGNLKKKAPVIHKDISKGKAELKKAKAAAKKKNVPAAKKAKK